MAQNSGSTFFASLERATPAELSRQSVIFTHSDMTRLLNFVPDIVLILNRERQIVFGNKAALDLLQTSDQTELLGLRLGELVKCRNADATGAGCGTSPFCRYCGGVNAVLTSIQHNVANMEECHLLTHDGCTEEALDLRVRASPFELNNERFTFLAVNDIAAEKTNMFLERVFMHDILNSALALAGFSDMLAGRMVEEEQRNYMLRRISLLSRRIIDEINAQQQLMAAEHGELVPTFKQIGTLDFLESLVGTYKHEAAHDRKTLRIAGDAQSIAMTTDEQLLSQVIGNMIKNALEASPAGETVTIGCTRQHGMVHFSVTNPAYMPEQIRAHIFTRSFSTKERDKGMGTYRMKYLTEKYLRGTVTFVTSEQDGTTFTAAYPLEI